MQFASKSLDENIGKTNNLPRLHNNPAAAFLPVPCHNIQLSNSPASIRRFFPWITDKSIYIPFGTDAAFFSERPREAAAVFLQQPFHLPCQLLIVPSRVKQRRLAVLHISPHTGHVRRGYTGMQAVYSLHWLCQEGLGYFMQGV